ncbi:MAG: CBS and ACT domain-containing protein [Pseudomonadota bacterium]
MLVKDWMSTKVITVDEKTSMQEAVNLMTDHNISMLPVMRESQLVGIVTDRDLKRAGPSFVALLEVKQILYHMGRVEMEAIMSRDPITVAPDFTVEETAEVLLNNRISGCPVMDPDGNLIGIITKNDLFRALVSVSGLKKRGIQLGFLAEDRSGSIREIADVIRQFGGRIVSIMSSYDKAPEGFRNVYVRAFELDRANVPEMLQSLKKRAKIVYMVDHRDNRREIFES